MPMQSWEAHLGGPLPGTAGTALANSTTITDISPAPQITMPANYLDYIGATLRLTAYGMFSTTATPTLLLGFYYGAVAGTALVATAATTTGTATNWPWRIEYTGVVRSIGSTGTIMGGGVCYLGTSATVLSTVAFATPQTAVTIDTTAAKAITAGATWGTANASNTITCHALIVESVA